jgi:hypothetical protein
MSKSNGEEPAREEKKVDKAWDDARRERDDKKKDKDK